MPSLCKICNSQEFICILDKKRTKIYTNREDSELDKTKLSCKLYQCIKCNFIFQQPTNKLKQHLLNIYQSEYAQLSQPLGEGNWGRERFNSLKKKIKYISLYKKKPILEIGCGNGFILKYLEKKGFTDLCGIDPSVDHRNSNNSTTFYKEFVNSKLKLNKKFDFIFSIGFYEHCFNINHITKFSVNHLSKKGKIFIIVPNFLKSLKTGNPDLFSHEHINYFTKKTIIKHFKNFNLKVIRDYTDDHAISLYLQKSKTKTYYKNHFCTKINYNYESKLFHNISKLSHYLEKYNCLIHGACNSLNNFISWSNYNYNFSLVDNDENKIGKIYFKKKIKSLKEIKLSDYDYVIIIPKHFVNDIKKNYVNRGFNGKFISLK